MVNQLGIIGHFQACQRQQAVLDACQRGRMPNNLGRQFDHGQCQVARRFKDALSGDPMCAVVGLTCISSPQRPLVGGVRQTVPNTVSQQAQNVHRDGQQADHAGHMVVVAAQADRTEQHRCPFQPPHRVLYQVPVTLCQYHLARILFRHRSIGRVDVPPQRIRGLLAGRLPTIGADLRRCYQEYLQQPLQRMVIQNRGDRLLRLIGCGRAHLAPSGHDQGVHGGGRQLQLAQRTEVGIAGVMDVRPRVQRPQVAIARVEHISATQTGAHPVNDRQVQAVITTLARYDIYRHRHAQRVKCGQHHLDLGQIMPVIFAVAKLEQSVFHDLPITAGGGNIHTHRRWVQVIDPQDVLIEVALTDGTGFIVTEGVQETSDRRSSVRSMCP